MEKYLLFSDFELSESYIDEMYEGKILDAFKSVYSKMVTELKMDFKFIGTFGMVITLFFPVVENLITNMKLQVDLNPTNVILATIGALAVLIPNNSSKLKMIYSKLKDKKWKGLIDMIVQSFKNIFGLFKFMAGELGKVVRSFADMLSYTLLFVPFLRVVFEYINTNNIIPKDLGGLLLSIGAGIAIIAGKNIMDVFKEAITKKNPKLKFI